MTPFVPESRLTAIAIGVRNSAFIADEVAPRADTGGTAEFKWTEYNPEETFTIPNTLVGRRSRTNDVEFTATQKNDAVEDYGLSDLIPYEDVMKAQNHPAFDPEGMATSKLSELVALDREKRVADRVMSAANYANSEVITAGDKWTASTSKPIAQIVDAMNSMLVTPNIMVLGRAEAWALRQNPQIIKAYNGSLGDEGLVPLNFIRELFGLEKIVVGESKFNAARKGQPMTLTQLWSGGASLIYQKPMAQLRDDLTFMLTAEWGGKVAARQELGAGEVGIRGGVRVTVGDSVKEVLISKEAGFFLQGVV
ncbi:hypothetical protein IT774_05120 [Salinimonas marina]|uniref:Capsid protein n=1 Tax=Salinimonas marina TaxID=2785918 RepID=A0A7S9DZ42_9ALTE|nr:hypothetical protein [Salinimonas marina]QPG06555.1 hypothetical protein IT774_05120 [Salinimonas marina]